MQLLSLIELLRLERDLKSSSLDQLRFTVGNLRSYLNREPVIDDLSDDTLNRWIDWMATTPGRHGKMRARRTIKTQRNNAVLLWNFAWESERLDRRQMRVKRIKMGPTLPEAWSEQQMSEWLAGCDKIGGFVAASLAPARIVMRGYSLVAWDTSARPCDILNLKRSEITADGVLVIVQQKTGHPVLCRLRPETVAVIDDLCKLSGKELVFPFNRATLSHHFAKVCQLTGLSGTPKKVRKSRATSAEIRETGSATAVLGHVPGSTVAYRSYIDRLQLLRDPGLPPCIDRRAE